MGIKQMENLKTTPLTTLATVRFIKRKDGNTICGFASSRKDDMMGDIFISGKHFDTLDVEEGDLIQCSVIPSNAEPRPNDHHRCYWYSIRTLSPNDKQIRSLRELKMDGLPDKAQPFNSQIFSQLKTIVTKPEEVVEETVFPTFSDDDLSEIIYDLLHEQNELDQLMLWTSKDITLRIVDKKWWQSKREMDALQSRVGGRITRMMRDKKEVLTVEITRTKSKLNSERKGIKYVGLDAVDIRLPLYGCIK